MRQQITPACLRAFLLTLFYAVCAQELHAAKCAQPALDSADMVVNAADTLQSILYSDEYISDGIAYVADGTFLRVIANRGLDNSADVSAFDDIVMAQPSLAFVNIVLTNGLPSKKGQPSAGMVEFYDGNGTYFKKPVSVSVQGAYSVRYPKKNFTCDFALANDASEAGTSLTIGDWVRQDSYHLKAFYTDVLRGIGEVGYKLYGNIVADRLPFWRRCGIDSQSKARCFPDAFPCVLFVNGSYHGVYAWQLKKSRKNMNMKKSCAEHIHLDGNLSDKYLFDGYVAWGQFEVRNPKGLYDYKGNMYDGDCPSELIDEKSKYFKLPEDDEKTLEAKAMTAAVKRHVNTLSMYGNVLKKIEKEGADTLRMRNEIEKRYEIQSLIDYYVLHHFIYNCDGSLKNWQWFTYDGQKWMVTPYDLDQTFGLNLYGVVRPATIPIEPLISGPFMWVDKYYKNDIRQRYCQLRGAGVLDAGVINSIVNEWHGRVGEEFYSMESSRWPDSPCYSDAICNNGWKVSDEWEKYAEVPSYSNADFYEPGDIVRYEGRLWQATQKRSGVKPCKRNANIDSVERICSWVTDRLDFLDIYYDYSPMSSVNDVEVSDALSSRATLTGIYNSSGERVPHPVKGVNIYRYSDGTSVKILVR